jgi:hypothetical protein
MIVEIISILFERLKISFKFSWPPGMALFKKKIFSNEKI